MGVPGRPQALSPAPTHTSVRAATGFVQAVAVYTTSPVSLRLSLQSSSAWAKPLRPAGPPFIEGSLQGVKISQHHPWVPEGLQAWGLVGRAAVSLDNKGCS